MKKTLTRKKKLIHRGGKVTTSHLEKYADIVIGHIPFGVHKNWSDKSTGKMIIPQYITFFREPFVKFVSSRLYVNESKRWTHQQAVDSIKSTIRTKNKKGEHYNAYISYLTTPKEKELGKKNKHSQEQWVQIIKKNIIDMHTVVGVVESMSESVELIQSIIDVNREQTKLFKRLISPSGSSSLVRNKSKLSSSKIVGILKKDETIWNMLKEILKYEFDVYEFAVKMHNLQVQELKKKHGDQYSFDSPATSQ